MPRAILIASLIFAIAIPFVDAVMAQSEPRLSPPSALDRQFLAQQRDRIDTMARRNLGRQLNNDRSNNLSIVQTLLDRRLVRADQTLELQAMGVVMGDELAREFNMKWIIYEDRYGRSRALRFGNTDNFLFPTTMISRRVEAGSSVDVEAVYRKAADVVRPLRSPLPFQ